jgi:hypothetical protein
MTPQERKLVGDLFDRLEKLENAPRDADAVNVINDGLDRAPNALYPLVQTVLVQDEALKRADARIRELESELGAGTKPGEQAGFLDNMRDTLRREQHGSVPSVRSGAGESKWGPAYGQAAGVPQGQPAYGQPPQQQESGGSSFLGTAAASAAGVIGGALLLNSFRGMFGGQQSGQSQGVFDQRSGGGAPWDSSASNSDLARDAGLGDIGSGGRNAAYEPASSDRAGLFDTALNDAGDDGDFDDGDFGGDGGVDT